MVKNSFKWTTDPCAVLVCVEKKIRSEVKKNLFQSQCCQHNARSAVKKAVLCTTSVATRCCVRHRPGTVAAFGTGRLSAEAVRHLCVKRASKYLILRARLPLSSSLSPGVKAIDTQAKPHPNKKETLKQCCFNVGPASQTMAQH